MIEHIHGTQVAVSVHRVLPTMNLSIYGTVQIPKKESSQLRYYETKINCVRAHEVSNHRRYPFTRTESEKNSLHNRVIPGVLRQRLSFVFLAIGTKQSTGSTIRKQREVNTIGLVLLYHHNKQRERSEYDTILKLFWRITKKI